MTSFNVKISDQEFEVECEEGDTILRAALRAGLGMPYECNSGGCGACKVEVLEGNVDNIWEDAPGLSPRDIKKGRNHSLQRGVHRRVLSNALFDSIPRKKFPPKKLTSQGR